MDVSNWIHTAHISPSVELLTNKVATFLNYLLTEFDTEKVFNPLLSSLNLLLDALSRYLATIGGASWNAKQVFLHQFSWRNEQVFILVILYL